MRYVNYVVVSVVINGTVVTQFDEQVIHIHTLKRSGPVPTLELHVFVILTIRYARIMI